MAKIVKKKTDGLRHVRAQVIKVVELPRNSTVPVCLVAEGNPKEGCKEVSYAMTKDSFVRAANGTGSINYNLRYGLVGSTRFSFVLMLEDCEDNNGKKSERVAGIHCLPRENYLAADFATELRRPELDKNSAVVNIITKTGEMDVVAFPEVFKSVMPRFLEALEKMEEIDELTTFKVGSVEFSCIYLYDRTVTFRCFSSGSAS